MYTGSDWSDETRTGVLDFCRDAEYIQTRTHLSSDDISEYKSEQCGMYGFGGIPNAL